MTKFVGLTEEEGIPAFTEFLEIVKTYFDIVSFEN
jgi:hypothetical protein